jgi:hypothetical protein
MEDQGLREEFHYIPSQSIARYGAMCLSLQSTQESEIQRNMFHASQ